MRPTSVPIRFPHPAFRNPAAVATALLLAIAAAAAAPAAAATYYLAPSGSDSNNGLSPGSAWATISKANGALRAGDTVILLPGSYSGTIAPSTSGTSTNRIRYVGSLDNPGSVTVGNVSLTKSFVTVLGVRSNSGVSINYPAQYDSVSHCTLPYLLFGGGKHSMVSNSTINGEVHFAANGGLACYDHAVFDPNCVAPAERDTLRGNVVNFGAVYPGDRAMTFHGHVQYCLVDSNRFSAMLTAGGSYPTESGIVMASYNSYYQTFRDNHWTVDANADHQYDTWRVITLRDSTHDYLFERDTLLSGVTSGRRIHVQVANSGNYPGTVRNNRWNACFYKFGGGNFETQDQWIGNTVENSVIASDDGRALYVLNTLRDAKFRNNTFYGGGQTIRFDEAMVGNNEFTSNIVYSRSVGAASSSGAQTMWMNGTSNLVSNGNLFFTPSYGSTPGDRSLGWCCYSSSRPGAGAGWNQRTGQDANSVYGSPLFADSSFATFDPTLRPGSRAIGAGLGGADAGAVPYGPDLIAPAAITNLDTTLVYDRTLVLKWTATGDNGTYGRADAYDLRVSTAPISEGSFASATPLTPPAVAVAGTPQSYVVTGLNPGVTYWFAIRARDENGNWSPLSNVRAATTAASDQVAPKPVNDLSAN